MTSSQCEIMVKNRVRLQERLVEYSGLEAERLAVTALMSLIQKGPAGYNFTIFYYSFYPQTVSSILKTSHRNSWSLNSKKVSVACNLAVQSIITDYTWTNERKIVHLLLPLWCSHSLKDSLQVNYYWMLKYTQQWRRPLCRSCRLPR